MIFPGDYISVGAFQGSDAVNEAAARIMANVNNANVCVELPRYYFRRQRHLDHTNVSLYVAFTPREDTKVSQ